MELGGLLRLGHALAGVAFLSGLIGLWILTAAAARADSLTTMRLLLRVAAPFDRMVTGGGITLTVLGLATAFAIGRPLFGPLQGGPVDWMFVSILLMLPIFGFLALVYPGFAKRLRVALAAAEVSGDVTPDLRAVWAEPTYRFARRYELAAVVAVIALMISKPF